MEAGAAQGGNRIGVSAKTLYAGNRGVIVFADKNLRRESCLLVIISPPPHVASKRVAGALDLFSPPYFAVTNPACVHAEVRICFCSNQSSVTIERKTHHRFAIG